VLLRCGFRLCSTTLEWVKPIFVEFEFGTTLLPHQHADAGPVVVISSGYRVLGMEEVPIEVRL
jgi:hypothetical protein